MIRVTLIFMACAACTVIYNAANRASLDTALQLAAMLALGVTGGVLYQIQKMKGE
jgi:hypothetical protein